MPSTRTRIFIFATLALVAVQAIVLHLLGQPAICTCGYVELWHGVVESSGNSQHLTDWYTFSHVIHGFIFYFALWFAFPRMSGWQRLALATGIEVAWELFENTPWLIEHYRQQALAQGYTGDSVINSISDTCAMIIGFLIAYRLPVWATVAVALGLEATTGILIRDGLTFNIINLFHQFDFIQAWQSGA